MVLNTHFEFLDFPSEVVLHIFSYLDLPDLAALANLAPSLARVAEDPVLHKYRLNVVAPSRVQHSLFGASAEGLTLRPTVGDLVQRGVMKGLGIERHWRMGNYFYSARSIIQYENSRRLARQHASNVVSTCLRRRPLAPNLMLMSLHLSHVIPDVESSSTAVSRPLVPMLHKLKWSLQRDHFARLVRKRSVAVPGMLGFGAWLESMGQAVVEDGERVRLAICPGVRRIIAFYEQLGQT